MIWVWIALTLICIGVEAFYAMMEMAMVSCNKVRLQYYVSQGLWRAHWVYKLLQRPSHLFGTTLLGINIALQVGSQCSREVYQALGLDPAIAPVTQIFLVLVFAELAPLFAARRYAEQVAMLGIPVIYFSSKVMLPIIWVIGLITRAVNWAIRGPHGSAFSTLSREELQHLVEQHGEEYTPLGSEDRVGEMVQNIFSMRGRVARDCMTPVAMASMLPSESLVSDCRGLLRTVHRTCVPVYFRSRSNIVGLAFPRDLVRAPDHKRLRDYCRPPWFITQEMPIMQILNQFRRNGQSVAVVLDSLGQALGLLELDDVIALLFGPERPLSPGAKTRKTRRTYHIERSFPASTRVSEFNMQFNANLPGEAEETLAQLMTRKLGRPPDEGDRVRVGRYVLLVTESTLLGARTIVVRTRR